MRYKYTMLLSPIIESALLSFMENTDAKLITKVSIEVESTLSEQEKIAELDKKIGTKPPDSLFEFVGYEDLVKIIK